MSAGRDALPAQHSARRPATSPLTLLLLLAALPSVERRAYGVDGNVTAIRASGGTPPAGPGGGYFRMPSVIVVVPRGQVRQGSSTALLAALASPAASYALLPDSHPWLRIHPRDGQLWLAPDTPTALTDFLDAAANGLQLKVRASWDGLAPSAAEMRIIITAPPKKTSCEDLGPESLCFWESFMFSIKENERPAVLGPFRPPYLHQLCPQYTVTYVIAKGSTDNFDAIESPGDNWQLHTKTQFDREVADEWNLTLECHLSTREDYASVVQRNITVTILDEDDSPPTTKTTTHEDYIINPEVKKGQSLDTGRLVVHDADSLEVNYYVIETMEESNQEKLFDITLKMQKCNLPRQEPPENTSISSAFGENDSRLAYPSSTVIHIEVAFAKDTKLTNHSYCTTFILKDETLKGGEHSINQVTLQLKLEVRFNEKSSKIKGNTSPTAVAYSKIITEDEKIDITSAYPASVQLPASASSYARIAQPPQSHASLDARLLPTESPFAITPSNGIIYLRSAPQLRPGVSHIISVHWGAERQAATINVTVGASHANCNKSSQHTFCSSKKFADACGSSCGVGSWGYCTWKESNAPPAPVYRLSSHYTTCSPQPSTCPDGDCDELEELTTGICPQDCTRDVFGTARGHPSGHQGRGIKSATGVCSCDTFGKCSCGPVGAKAASTAHPTPAAQPGIGGGHVRGTADNEASFNKYHETCGETCFVAVLLGVLAALSIVLAGVILARRRIAKRGGHHVPSSASAALAIPLHPRDGGHVEASPLGIQSQIYGHDVDMSGNAPPELPLLSVHPMEMVCIRQLPRLQEPRDTRWEIPRQALQLEGALGEGEFGMVLKAKLRSPLGPDNPVPYMTVAVKTLKEGAGEMERTALASEFKLLQNVNHINIIRLIGACAIPMNQSFLLVIEYADLGSLRNYLRNSRLSDVDGAPLQRLPIARPNANEIECSNANVETSSDLLSPRHILSFAWQISKGMTYLSDMKLVHRDLAARNVLLTEKGICKISDFGLTRDVYEDEAYYKRSKGRVPVKWMAPESLSDHLYTTHSDVWGFGVLLWELVTLGASPYPGVPLSGLYSLLLAGYRMQKPTNCSPELYQIMMCCWKPDPSDRPSFQCLMASLESMLQGEVEYLNLGTLFALNPTYFSPPPGDIARHPLLVGEKTPVCHRVERPHADEDGAACGRATDSRCRDGDGEAARCLCDWRELDGSDEESSNAKTSLKSSFSISEFKVEDFEEEFEDGYEVPINCTSRFQ